MEKLFSLVNKHSKKILFNLKKKCDNFLDATDPSLPPDPFKYFISTMKKEKKN